MAVRNLDRQARPFRYLGYALLATVVLLLPDGAVGRWSQWLVLAVCVLGPIAVDALLRTTQTLDRDDLVRRVQRIENVCAPALLVAGSVPTPVILAVIVCLAAANVALAGRGGMFRTTLELALGCWIGMVFVHAQASLWGASSLPSQTESLGWNVTAALPPTQWVEPAVQPWWLAVSMIALFTLALSDVGFRLTQRLDGHREQVQERAKLLAYFAPPGLPVGSGRVASVSNLDGRQWLTVCMVDLVAFTRISAGLAPETVAQVLDDLLDTVVAQANRAQGTLDKFTGDGALLFFATADRVGGVESALVFADALMAQLADLNDKWQSHGLMQPLQVRIGIAAGYCSLGQCGTGEVRAYTLVGPSVALAERLQAASLGNGWLLCPVSARLLRRGRHGRHGRHGRQGRDQSHASPALELSADFVVEARGGRHYRLQEVMLELKGFPRMRAFRCSAKVPTLM